MNTILQVISDTNIGGGGRSLLNYLSCQDRSQFQSQVVLPRGSALKGPVEALGVPVHEIDAMADRSMDLSAVAPLRRVIRAVDPDLVHTHGSMSARMAARLCGKKVIYTKHCVFPLGRVMGSPVGRLAGHVLDACLSDGAIAVSPSVRELLLQSGVPDRKIHVLFNGVAPLAGCVARLMDDPALLRKLGEGAKRSFEENYTGEIFAKHVEDVYRDVLKGVSHGTK